MGPMREAECDSVERLYRINSWLIEKYRKRNTKNEKQYWEKYQLDSLKTVENQDSKNFGWTESEINYKNRKAKSFHNRN